MVSTSTNDSDIDSVTLVPASIAVNNIDSVSCVQVIDGTFSVDFPYLFEKHMSVRCSNGKDPRPRSVKIRKQRCLGGREARFPYLHSSAVAQSASSFNVSAEADRRLPSSTVVCGEECLATDAELDSPLRAEIGVMAGRHRCTSKITNLGKEMIKKEECLHLVTSPC